MRRILVISDHGDPLAGLGGIQSGGQNVYVRELALALDKLGWLVDIFTHWSETERPQVEKLGSKGRIIRLGGGHRGFVPKDQMVSLIPAFTEELLEWVSKNKVSYQLIHSNYWLSGWIAEKLAKRWEIPWVHVSHSLGMVKVTYSNSSVPGTRIRKERQILHRADSVIATSPQEKEILCKSYSVPATKVKVIPCGVDPLKFFPREQEKDRTALGWKKQEKIVLFVGRPEPAKGLEVLMRALNHLSKKTVSREKLVLVIIGGHAGEAWEMGRKLGVEYAIRLLGPVPHEKIPVYYGAADVCAVPSFYESFGLVAIEAMACGCPVVASAVGGLQFTVKNGLTGLLVNPGQPQDLARALEIVLTDPTLRLNLARQAARWVAHHFTWPQVAKQISTLYQEMLQWKNAQREPFLHSSF